jgi:hypothetical protein
MNQELSDSSFILRSVAFEDSLQDHSLIALLIPRAVHQGDGVFFGRLFQ